MLNADLVMATARLVREIINDSLLEQAGFVVETFDVSTSTEVELAELDKLKIHKSFAQYSREELAGRNLFFVARKP